MWRPVLEVRAAARAYIACLEAPEDTVRGQVFNAARGNYRVSELALRVCQALRAAGESAEIGMEPGHEGVCACRVSCAKINRGAGFIPEVSLEDSVADMLLEIRATHLTDFHSARYCNARWVQLLLEAEKIIRLTGSVLCVDRKAARRGRALAA